MTRGEAPSPNRRVRRPIARLPVSLSAQLWGSRTVTSFASAACHLLHSSFSNSATWATLSIFPAALRLALHDDGVPREPPAALTTVASVQVTTRNRAGEEIVLSSLDGDDVVEDGVGGTGRGSAGSGQKFDHFESNGGREVVVEVWELFEALPVRKKAARSAGQVRLVESVRKAVGAMALANGAAVAVRLVVEDGVRRDPLLDVEGGSGGMLRLSHVAQALGDFASAAMVPLVEPSSRNAAGRPFRLQGFVSLLPVVGASEAQVVSVDGIVLGRGSALHRLVRAAWRRCWFGGLKASSGDAGLPAFVINAVSVRHWADVVMGADDEAADLRFFEPSGAADAVREAMEHTFAAAHTPASVDRLPDIFPNSHCRPHTNHRRTMLSSGGQSFALPKRLSTRLPCRRPSIVKPFRPAARRSTSKDATTVAEHPLVAALDLISEKSVLDRRPGSAPAPNTPNATSTMLRSQNSSARLTDGRAPVMRRPKSSFEVRQGLSASAPSWKSPVFASRGRQFGSTVFSCRAKCCPKLMDPALDLRHIRMTREDIEGLTVVGQADRKFIIVVDRAGVLYAVDQHAASERVHFERLQQSVSALDGTGVEGVQPKGRGLTLKLTRNLEATLKMHDEHLRRWGWLLLPHQDSSEPRPVGNRGGMLDRRGGSSGACPSEVAYEVFLCPRICETGVVIGRADQLRSHLEGLMNGIQSRAVPQPIVEALATSACHGAVRFGDPLTHEQCCAIVRGLAKCDLPFSCAHGRPSIVPLVVLQ